MEKYGFTYNNLPTIPTSDTRYARHQLFRAFSWAVWNSSVLEGYNFTMSEVETIINGYTVGGHPNTHEDDVRGIAAGWKVALTAIDDSRSVDESLVRDINFALTNGMTLAPGKFRGEDPTLHGDGGTVSTPRGTYVAPKPDQLHELWNNFSEDDPVESACLRIPFQTLTQFFYDGNKRTAMMTAAVELIQAGHAPLVVQGKDFEEWHSCLTTLFHEKGAQPLFDLLGKSTLQM